MKIKQAAFLFVMLIFLVSCSGKKANENVKDGLYQISDFPEADVEKLNGNWEFYWQELLTPDDFAKDSQSAKWMVEVPDPWSSYEKDGERLSKQGYATYRLHMEFPESEIGTTKSLYVPGVSSAYKLWVSGELEAENGVVGKSRDLMVPKKGARMVQFQVHDKQVELVMQVSNFYQRKAGIFDSILIGEPERIAQYREKKLLFRSMIVVSLIVMGLYHVVLFALRRKELSLLFFGVICLLISIRASLLDGILASYTLPFISWEWGNKLEYIGASLGVLFFTLFTYTQFPKDMSSNVRNAIVIVMATYSLFVIVTPSIIFTNTMQLLQLAIILVFSYLIHVDTKALIRRRESSLLNAVANLIIFLAIINDVLFYNHFIQTTELASVGLFFFLFTQSIIISRHYSRSFKQTEKLSYDLARLNVSLEQQVHDRTMELRQINKELQTANQKLNEAHQSRSKWIRNIYHEIATPLTTIRAYMKGILDGVIEGDRKFIQLVHEQSLYLSRLLNDLHDMTEIENREITFNRKKINVREYAQNLYEKYKVDIEKQGISFLYENSTPEEEDIFVLIDKHRIEQVIVNFLTNAQKFIGNDGFIKMEVEKDDDHQVVVKIQDNGVGISEKEIGLVFDRFFKNRSQEIMSAGSGLGLAISKEIIEFHGGTIGVTSQEGEGSCFYFMLPIVSTVSKTHEKL
ncbi:hypothetical protein D4T97_020190 [Siminovitchia acidinfaciens]|uniref:histidine kinase n=1 Tax=Siminovitchia acidinfaciens TaxID=2321395 RepID=A0A429XSW3_9BACI|nr:sensor histidine kinase [Siminovitchia acidinfaciens]RST70313.1 hypothetical protein D4T97_020190 [Siminovitchia acidinfaciens]